MFEIVPYFGIFCKKGGAGYDWGMKRIYLDHAAATPISAKAFGVVSAALKKFPGNPSAIHREGKTAHAALEVARTEIAQNLV